MFTIKNLFVVYSLSSYLLFFLSFVVTDFTIIQLGVYFFASALVLFLGLMIYGFVSGLWYAPRRSTATKKKHGLESMQYS